MRIALIFYGVESHTDRPGCASIYEILFHASSIYTFVVLNPSAYCFLLEELPKSSILTVRICISWLTSCTPWYFAPFSLTYPSFYALLHFRGVLIRIKENIVPFRMLGAEYVGMSYSRFRCSVTIVFLQILKVSPARSKGDLRMVMPSMRSCVGFMVLSQWYEKQGLPGFGQVSEFGPGNALSRWGIQPLTRKTKWQPLVFSYTLNDEQQTLRQCASLEQPFPVTRNVTTSLSNQQPSCGLRKCWGTLDIVKWLGNGFNWNRTSRSGYSSALWYVTVLTVHQARSAGSSNDFVVVRQAWTSFSLGRSADTRKHDIQQLDFKSYRDGKYDAVITRLDNGRYAHMIAKYWNLG